MDAKITDSSSKEISLTITKSDIATLYIVQHELLKEPGVEFAGVIMKHPLTKEYWMRVNTSKGNPLKEIEKATKVAIEYANELKKLVNSKIKGA
jgi:DNA-directed RNA polymerase subunit L